MEWRSPDDVTHLIAARGYLAFPFLISNLLGVLLERHGA
jgi:hypothetical protein